MTTTVRYTTINGEVIAEKRNGIRKQYVPDPLGSTVALLDNTQTQTDTFSYWPYGEVNTRTGTTPTPFQFLGTEGYYQDSSGDVYVRARYLDKTSGKWLSEDPISFDGGDFNLYNYAFNSPALNSDPSGEGPDANCWAREYLFFARQGGLSPAQACQAANQSCGTDFPCSNLPPVPAQPIRPEPPSGGGGTPPPGSHIPWKPIAGGCGIALIGGIGGEGGAIGIIGQIGRGGGSGRTPRIRPRTPRKKQRRRRYRKPCWLAAEQCQSDCSKNWRSVNNACLRLGFSPTYCKGIADAYMACCNLWCGFEFLVCDDNKPRRRQNPFWCKDETGGLSARRKPRFF